MSNKIEKLTILIDKIPEIENCFEEIALNVKQSSIVKHNSFERKPPIITRTIHKNPEFIQWRNEIFYEIQKLPECRLTREVEDVFGKIKNGYSDEKCFTELKSKLMILKENLEEIANRDSKDGNSNVQAGISNEFTEEKLCYNVLKALLSIQKNPIYKGRKEDEINDGIRDCLNMMYDVRDQTRQGESESGKSAGEVDLSIYKNELPYVIIEALRLTSLDQENLDKHIDKALTKYDPMGCPYTFIFTYATGADFERFYRKFFVFVTEYDFPYEPIGHLKTINHDYSESKHLSIKLNRNGSIQNVHFYIIHVR